MAQLCQSLVLALCSLWFVTGIDIQIEPRIAYEGSTDVTVRCELDLGSSNISTIGSISILKSDIFRQLLVLENGGQRPVWGDYFEGKRLGERSTVTWRLETNSTAYLQVVLQNVECADDDRYTCELYGLDLDHQIVKERSGDHLFIRSFSSKPEIRFQGKPLPNKELVVCPGTSVSLTCSGNVGKPRVPIFWYVYNMEFGAFEYLYTGDNNAIETFMIDESDMCRYKGDKILTYQANENKPEVTFRCQIGVLEETVSVITRKEHADVDGHPVINYNGQTVMNNLIRVENPEALSLSCAGDVTDSTHIVWLLYDDESGDYNVIESGEETVITKNLSCSTVYTKTKVLEYEITEDEEEVSFVCKLGKFENLVTVIVGGTDSEEEKEDHDELIEEVGNGRVVGTKDGTEIGEQGAQEIVSERRVADPHGTTNGAISVEMIVFLMLWVFGAIATIKLQ